MLRQGAPQVRRKTFWIGSADSTDFFTLAAGAAVLDQSITWTDELGPSTIVRTRGELWVGTDQIAASESPFGALGMSVVRSAAAAAGVGSVPTPITEESDDSFFVWQAFASSLLFGDATGFRPYFERYSFDSKAMRKVSQGDTIAITLENASVYGLRYILKFRMLIKTG